MMQNSTAAQLPSKRGLFSWALFDWANSAFPTVIVTFIFSAYFAQAVAPTPQEGQALWGETLAWVGLAVAVLSPILGAIADQGGRRKPWLGGFTVLCLMATAALWFVTPDPSSIPYALTIVFLAAVAAEFSYVFYNSMLPDLVNKDWYGRLSGWGWGLGYAGGLSCLIISLFVFVQNDDPPFGLDRDNAEHVRATVLLVVAWFGLFSLPLFFFTPDRVATKKPIGQAARDGLKTLWGTLRRLRARDPVARFLIGRMLYTEGLNTLFAFGGIYAIGVFGLTLAEVIQFGIAMNVTAGIGAAVMAWVDDKIGPKYTIAIALLGLIGLGSGLLIVESQTSFWILGLPLGLFVGPAQASSRSMMSHLAPEEIRTEMFGLYALSGKATAFLGPAALGWATAQFASQRAGMATIMVFLTLGLLILLTVPRQQKD